MISDRYSKANNKYYNLDYNLDYNPEKPSKYLKNLDANNL